MTCPFCKGVYGSEPDRTCPDRRDRCGYCARICENCQDCTHQDQDWKSTTVQLIANRNWNALDESFGLLEHRAQTVVLYAMLKALLERTSE